MSTLIRFNSSENVLYTLDIYNDAAMRALVTIAIKV